MTTLLTLKYIMQSMSPTSHIASSKTSDESFLLEWTRQQIPRYIKDYGGDRLGIPKGENIPFPKHKVEAGLALLRYGAPNLATLNAIAETTRVSSALLRVWRSEERFLSLYRQALWACTDDYLRLLAKSWKPQLASPSDEINQYFGVALQEALFRRIWVDVLHVEQEWTSLGLTAKWQSELALVGPPLDPPPRFSKDELRMIQHNAHLLLASSLSRFASREPALAHWASLMWLTDLTRQVLIQKDLREAVEAMDKKRALELIDFVTNHSPIDDWRKLYRLIQMNKESKNKE